MTLFLACAVSLFLALGLASLARRKSGYSHRRDTISELGEFGTPDQRLVSVGFFGPIGLTALLIAGLTFETSRPAAGLALCLAIGYLVAAVFPCDPGSPMSGSARQAVHNLGGGIEYFGGGVALIVLGETLGRGFAAAGVIVLASALLLSFPFGWRGLVQRVAEACLFGGLLAAVWLQRA
ncbi:MAG: DUF998 domain-containing protein [Thermoanaerobaculia bacterium]|nr:DUF998 domain-containing protein [Thermoanaerobaculia bacterium]